MNKMCIQNKEFLSSMNVPRYHGDFYNTIAAKGVQMILPPSFHPIYIVPLCYVSTLTKIKWKTI